MASFDEASASRTEYFWRRILLAVGLTCWSLDLLFASHSDFRIGLGLMAVAGLIIALAFLRRRYTSWSLTSDRLIEPQGLIAHHRREMELADIRSVEIDRSFAASPDPQQTEQLWPTRTRPFAV